MTGVTAADKIYDGGLVAVIQAGGASLPGPVSSGSVTLKFFGCFGYVSSKDVQLHPVAISGLSLGGANAGDYSLTQPSTTASITKIALTVTGITADDKVYDGGTGAVIHTGGASLRGSWGSGRDTDHVGRVRYVCLEGRGQRHHSGNQSNGHQHGADSGNYTLAQPGTSASISERRR